MDKIVFLFVIALCGATNAAGENRIINGLPAEENQFPYAVSFQLIDSVHAETRGHRCGGALISYQHVLTAAACMYVTTGSLSTPIEASRYRVFAGGVSLSENTTERVRLVENYVVHPQYKPSEPYVNDIAIITLSEPFSSETVKPVELSTADPSSAELNVCTVAGWGGQDSQSSATTQLMYIQKSVYSQTLCSQSFGSVVNTRPLNNILSSMICAYSTVMNAGCAGDVGNPLVCKDRITGVLTLNNGCIPTVLPEVYTRVSSYNQWINGVVTGGASTFQPGIAVLALFAIVQFITANIIA